MLDRPDLAETYLSGVLAWATAPLSGWVFWLVNGLLCIPCAIWIDHKIDSAHPVLSRTRRALCHVAGVLVVLLTTLGFLTVLALGFAPTRQRDEARAYALTLEAQRHRSLALIQTREILEAALNEAAAIAESDPNPRGSPRSSAWLSKLVLFIQKVIRGSAAERGHEASRAVLDAMLANGDFDHSYAAIIGFRIYIAELTENDIDTSWIPPGKTWETWTASKVP